MLEKVKVALRITHNQLDGEITDLIAAATLDLGLSGVETSALDPLLNRAIILYVKANFGLMNVDSEKYQKSYDLLKMHLSLSDDYKVEVV